MECLRRNPKALTNINVTLYGATTSMVVASKLLEPQHISYVIYIQRVKRSSQVDTM